MEAGPGEQLMWGIKNGDMELVQLLINKVSVSINNGVTFGCFVRGKSSSRYLNKF